LTITAASQSIIYGASVPATTLSYSGFANGQSSTDLTTQPSVSSTENGVVAVGAYANNYVPSGASDSNYQISYVDGDLTVNAAPAPSPVTMLPSTVVVVSQDVPVYTSAGIGSSNPIAIADSSALVSPDTSSQTSDQSSGSSSQTQSKPQSANANYTGNAAAGVNPSGLSVFGGILTISPELVSKFKLGYLKGKS